MLLRKYPFVWIFALYIIIIFIEDPILINIFGEGYKNIINGLNIQTIILEYKTSDTNFLTITISDALIILSIIILFIKLVKIVNLDIFNLKLYISIVNITITTLFLLIFIAFDWSRNITFLILILISYAQSIGELLIINFINRIYSLIMFLTKKDAKISELKIKDFTF